MPQLYPLLWFKVFIMFNLLFFIFLCILNCVYIVFLHKVDDKIDFNVFFWRW